MTYFGFLAVFLCLPVALLWLVQAYDARRGTLLPALWRARPVWLTIAAQAVIAVIYTTPWDNYLVATRVWWYNPGLVTGFIIGYVPIEEYTFFVLQTVLTACWLLLLVRRFPRWDTPSAQSPANLRLWLTSAVGLLWLVFVVMLIVRWEPGRYLALLMTWALPPLMLQVGFGADILVRSWRYIVLAVVPMTIYLGVADKLAISSGTWTINPEQSLNIFVFGTLPIEEFIFFFMTNLLVAVGITLICSTVSQARLNGFVQSFKSRRKTIRQL
ncbi:MAG: lycopene cyclase domain-containing protein [Chloroflexi bacterium]|nr:lycopene cyclase domain-containing protein [Chloroflexota bacterium]MCC6893990.1 lycopene cyclase domain-containing protein [Anaerolineae bacterium]